MLVAFERVADQPEHGWPKADEESATLGVAAFILVDRLGTDPKADAEADRRERGGMAVPTAQARNVQPLAEHRWCVPDSGRREARSDCVRVARAG
jgi:hypothetical protein